MTDVPVALTAWHGVVDSHDPALLEDLVGEECIFHSPAVHTPQKGKALTTAYLSAAMDVLGESLTYRHEWYDESSAVLEFTAEVNGLAVHGVDMLRWDGEDRLVEFTVMLRPFKGLTAVMEQMAARLP